MTANRRDHSERDTRQEEVNVERLDLRNGVAVAPCLGGPFLRFMSAESCSEGSSAAANVSARSLPSGSSMRRTVTPRRSSSASTFAVYFRPAASASNARCAVATPRFSMASASLSGGIPVPGIAAMPTPGGVPALPAAMPSLSPSQHKTPPPPSGSANHNGSRRLPLGWWGFPFRSRRRPLGKSARRLPRTPSEAAISGSIACSVR